ncbi:MAG TPA: M48 family metalloprotease [Thermoanaerobaculia bacterium]|nr:M48 family metalloprotease [Thermoanaerobaculia bacterium]
MRAHARRTLLPLAVILLAACATNPVTGKRQLAMITESQEIAMGQEAARQVAAQMGLYDDPELQAYVDRVGQEMAAVSERPEIPWQFAVVDDPTVNAFALPGGPVFLTRGILAHFNNEAEMASVLGHEIGHITARHAVEQVSKQQLAGLGLGLAMILSPEVAQFGDLANLGLQLMFLKFGRDDERQSDDLGLRYMTDAGWDPRHMPPVFGVISEISRLQGGGRIPAWASTHPDPENRAQRLAAQIGQLGAAGGRVNPDGYLAMLDGMIFGENPREGYVIGSAFIHPDLAFRITFPEGWAIQNMRQQVIAVSPREDAAVGLSLARGSSPAEAARSFFSQQGIQAGSEWRQNIYTFQAGSAQQGAVYRGLAGFVSHRGQVLQIVGYTPAQLFDRYANLLAGAVASFTSETNPTYVNVEPKRIDVVKVPRRMTLEEFARAYPSTVDLQTLAIANGAIRQDFVFEPGQPAKRIVGGRLPTR